MLVRRSWYIYVVFARISKYNAQSPLLYEEPRLRPRFSRKLITDFCPCHWDFEKQASVRLIRMTRARSSCRTLPSITPRCAARLCVIRVEIYDIEYLVIRSFVINEVICILSINWRLTRSDFEETLIEYHVPGWALTILNQYPITN